jgi:tetratricopeptide (TPR) repeat protein
MAFLGALVIGLIALIVAPGYAFYFDVTPKAVVLLAGTAGMLILAARGGLSVRGPRLFGILLLLNAASLAVSTALSSNPSLSLYGGTWRCLGLLMQYAAMLFAWLVACEAAGRPDRIRVILRGVAIAGFFAAAYAIVRPPGALDDSSNLAAWLPMSGFLSLALANLETRPPWRVMARTAGALTLATLVVIGMRGAPWLGPHRFLWRDSLSMAAGRALAGYGPEVFLADFPHFQSKALAQASPDSVYESPRNAFLDALISQGVPGLLLLCGLGAVGIAAAWKRKAPWLAVALAAGIGSLQFTSFLMPTALLFLTTIGLAAALGEEPRAPRPCPILAGVAPFLVLALLYFALRLAMADHSLAVTRRLLDAHELRAASAEYETYWFWRLPGASADVWYSRSWMELAQAASDPAIREQSLTIAAEAARRATGGVAGEAEEPFLAWYNRAQISALQDNFEDAEASLRKAIAAHPNWYRPHWMLAQQLRRESRLEEAGDEAAIAAELDRGHHPEIAMPAFR